MVQKDWLEQVYLSLLDPMEPTPTDLPGPVRAGWPLPHAPAAVVDRFVGALNSLGWIHARICSDGTRAYLATAPRSRWDAGLVAGKSFSRLGGQLLVTGESSDVLITAEWMAARLLSDVSAGTWYRAYREECLALDRAETPLWIGEGIALLVAPDERRGLFAAMASGASSHLLGARQAPYRAQRLVEGPARVGGIHVALGSASWRGDRCEVVVSPIHVELPLFDPPVRSLSAWVEGGPTR